MPNVTCTDILTALRSLGVSPGDLMSVHSSLSAFGRVDGGAKAVVDSLIQSVSPGGSLFLPTFNYAKLPFDAATTPSLAGAISETFRQTPGVLRSLQPTHPWAGLGPVAADVLKGHENATPFGPGSPVWKLWEKNAWVLLLGVDQRANSTVHVAEEAENLPYLDRTRVAEVIIDGQPMKQTVRRPGHSGGFNKLNAELRARGQLRETKIGDAPVMLMRSADVVALARKMLRTDAAALLCGDATCERCAEARETIAKSKPPRP
jgi:aminoglycoside N3'-acetyltransferase